MRLNSYPKCDLGLLIRGIMLSIGIPYEINVRIDYTDQHDTHCMADQLISIEPIIPPAMRCTSDFSCELKQVELCNTHREYQSYFNTELLCRHNETQLLISSIGIDQ